MAERQTRAAALRARRKRARRLGVLVVCGLVALLYAGPIRTYLDARAAADASRADVLELRAKRADLQRRLDALDERATIEALARESGWIYPGETPYLIRDARP